MGRPGFYWEENSNPFHVMRIIYIILPEQSIDRQLQKNIDKIIALNAMLKSLI